MKRPLNISESIDTLKAKGFSIFKELTKPYNLNIVGYRDTSGTPNQYNDWLHVYWRVKKDQTWKEKLYPITTVPGVPYLTNPLNKKGSAVLAPGQYLSAYSLGLYKGKYALLQMRDVVVYRDNDKDFKAEKTLTKDEGLFGIHIHRGSFFSNFVGRNSAGCQVFQSSNDCEDFMDLCADSIASGWPNAFTYTLVEI
jgi:hypothetical protein